VQDGGGGGIVTQGAHAWQKGGGGGVQNALVLQNQMYCVLGKKK